MIHTHNIKTLIRGIITIIQCYSLSISIIYESRQSTETTFNVILSIILYL